MRAAPIFMRVAAAKAQEYSMGRGSKLPDGRCSRQSQQSRSRGSSLLKGMIDDDAERSDGGDNVPVSLKCRRTHERVLALTAVPRELTGVLLEAPPFRFGETEMPGRNETSAGEKFRRGRPAGPCPPHWMTLGRVSPLVCAYAIVSAVGVHQCADIDPAQRMLSQRVERFPTVSSGWLREQALPTLVPHSPGLPSPQPNRPYLLTRPARRQI